MNAEIAQLTVSLDDFTTLLWDRLNHRYCRYLGPDKSSSNAVMVFASPERARQYLDVLARSRAERKNLHVQYRPQKLDLVDWLKTVQELHQEGFRWLILHTPEHRGSKGAIGHAHIAIQDVLDKVAESANDHTAEPPRWVVDGQHRHGGPF